MLRQSIASNIKRRMATKKNNYSSRLTRKEPPKKLKDPLEKFKNAAPENKKIIKHISEVYTNFFKTKNLRTAQINNRKILITISNIDIALRTLRQNKSISSKDGRDVHFLFPLTAMAGIGEFYKGYLEQILPKARFTFLVTPSTSLNTSSEILSYKEFMNLKQNFERSVNINDRVFIIIDFFLMGTTYNKISEIIEKSFKDKKINPQIHGIHSFVEHNSSSFFNVYKGKDTYGKSVFSKHQGVKSKKEIENIKEKEKIIKYTFYYLGWLTAMKKTAKR